MPTGRGYQFHRRTINPWHVIEWRGLRVEIDGRLHEDDPYVFENDRLRQNALVRSGWRVLRFTYAMLVNEPAYVIAVIRAALAQAGRA